ncbi:T9SS type A sorting domain-containing protein [Xanthocytophaga agilis]|uniref:T9SS type A sorting domain-containing protein n=1 Tax=Xanthocytophaga agilis TaxID=3048010 RepID=A0AAE3R392_9BACT|nr:T9SS type A sorting domain-containing protein [Xanthocytophaga agilis]MDJ1500575.1 T9SS type A sorting domain-containing protein [Xanthocytophaga agilis]
MENYKNNLWKKAGTLFLCWMAIFAVQGATIYVKSSAVGANNGSSWTNAYTSLQSALATAVIGDEIWVAAGVYKPSVQIDFDASGGSNIREVTFSLPNGVKLYGGFIGTEVSLVERNWTLNRTILSGDIDNNDINLDANAIAESWTDIVGNNAYHVVYTANVAATTLLDGFIITAGRAYIASPPNTNSPNLDGAGWYNKISAPQNASSPTIVHCTFQGNYAESEGAGFYTTPGTVFVTMESQIRECKFIQNKANFAGGAIFLGSFQKGKYWAVISQCEFTGNQAYRRGGALALTGDSTRIDTCKFVNNQAIVISEDGTTRPGSGGAVNMATTKAGFRRCIFIGNSATGNPTGAYEGGGGGAVYMSTNDPQTTTLGASKPVFIACGFYNNVAQGNVMAWGGAAVHLNDAGILRVKYINCVFAGNHAQNDGGAVANFTRVISPPSGFSPEIRTEFTNATFYGNSANRGGALSNDGYVSSGIEILTSRIENSILYGNTAVSSGQQVYNDGNVNTVSYSLVQGSGGSGGGWIASVGTDGGNNKDAFPSFVNAADVDGADNIPGTTDDGLRVNNGSPVINAGTNAVPNLAGITTDFAGDARIQNSKVDMGAYERYSFIVLPPKFYWLYPWKIIRPGCLTCPWAIRFDRGINENPLGFVWQSPAQLTDHGDYAEVVGTIVSQEDRSVQFDVYLKLVKPQDWSEWSSLQRTYKTNTPEARKVAERTHVDWTYWTLSARESYLKGKGSIEGTLQVSHAPKDLNTGFQLGVGANAQDADSGLSGEFYYQGTITTKARLRQNATEWKGIGSLNVDATECTDDCDTKSARIDNDSNLNTETESRTFTIYPNPARESVAISLRSGITTSYSVEMYTFQGQKLSVPLSEAGEGTKMINIKGLAAGLYYLKVTQEGGTVQHYKVVVQE